VNKLSHFEENLLTELRAVVAEQAGAPRRARPRGRLVLAAASVVAAGLVVGVPAMNGARAPAAHAVTSNPDGTLTITVDRLEDPEGLERELAAHGISADISFAPPGKMCGTVPERFPGQGDEIHQALLTVHGDEPLTVRPDDLAGKTLVIEGRVVTGWGTQQYFFAQFAVSGPVGPCVLVDIPQG
jgi:hypothetical protein